MQKEVVTYFLMIDCNSFYASCERLFRPELSDKPVVVLSNNDGCIIARSNEAKALGIPMGEPFFKIKELVAKHKVHVFSSNYRLYGDISERVVLTIRDILPDVEPYSVDEVFGLYTTTLDQTTQLVTLGTDIVAYVRGCTGIPVSVGIATTKTLAKAANKLAKKSPTGCVFFHPNASIDTYLEQLDVADVWGVGRKIGDSLYTMGIRTAKALKYIQLSWIQKKYGVTALRMVKELNGIPCIPFNNFPSERRMVMVSRSFRKDVTNLTHIQEAVSTRAMRLAEKLRNLHCTATIFRVFLYPNRFTSPHLRGVVYDTYVSIPYPTSDTLLIVKELSQAVATIFHPKMSYKKCGVMAMQLSDEHSPIQVRLDEVYDIEKSQMKNTLMAHIDHINRKHGKETVYIASAGRKKSWEMLSEARSRNYSTDWDDIPHVR